MKQKKAFTIIYIFFIISLILAMGIIVLNKQMFFKSEIEYSIINKSLSKNINTKYLLYTDYYGKDSTGSKTVLFGYAPNGFYTNIFWNNKVILDYIDSNTNTLSGYTKLSDVSSGALYFDIDGRFSGMIVKFDRNIYNQNGKLLKLSQYDFSSNSGVIGYLQSDGNFATGTTNAYYLDFKNNDYGIFLKGGTNYKDYVKYKLAIFNQNGTGVYINPIKDDSGFEYLANYIIIYKSLFVGKMDKIKK